MLLNQEIGYTSGKLQADGSCDRSAALVRSDKATMCQGEVCHCKRIGDTAQTHWLRLKDIHPASRGEGIELADGIVHFPCRNADRAPRGDGICRLFTLARRRFLPPIDVKRGKLLRCSQSIGFRESSVHIDENFQVIAMTSPQCGYDVVAELQLAGFDKIS